MHLRLWGILALCLLAVRPAYADKINFDDFVLGQPLSTTPQSTDSMPIIQGGETRQVFPYSSFMRPDASNASLPDARINLGLGTTSNPTFESISASSLDLVGLSGIIGTDRILSVAYGTVGTPLPTNSTSGGSAASFTVYATPGTGLADAITVALQGDTHLTAGSRGLAVGGVFRGYTSGTWDPDGSFNAGSVGVWAVGESTRGGVVFGVFGAAKADTTALVGGGANGAEFDLSISVSTPAKYGVAIVSATGDTGAVTSSSTVTGSGASVLQSAAILVQAPVAGATGFKYGIVTIDSGAEQPIQTAGSLWRAGGYTVTNGLDWPDMTFSGNPINLSNFTVDGAGSMQITRALASDAQSTFIKLKNTAASDAVWSGIAAVSYAGFDEARIAFISNSLSNFRTGIAFSTNSGAGLAEKARFDHNSGNLLIGTTTDCTEKLCVQGAVNVTGTVSAAIYKFGAIQLASNDGSYTYIRNGSGAVDAILLGPTGDPSNYYDRTNHVFRGNSGSGTHATITSAGLTVPLSTPASASATGVVGTIKWDANFVYICTATNTWKRAAIATW